MTAGDDGACRPKRADPEASARPRGPIGPAAGDTIPSTGPTVARSRHAHAREFRNAIQINLRDAAGAVMMDYRALLRRAIEASEAHDDRARPRVYAHARQLLEDDFFRAHPPRPLAEIATQRTALNKAIEEIEREFAGRDAGGSSRSAEDADPTQPPPAMRAGRDRRRRGASIASALLAASVFASAYVYWSSRAAPPDMEAGHDDAGRSETRTVSDPDQ